MTIGQPPEGRSRLTCVQQALSLAASLVLALGCADRRPTAFDVHFSVRADGSVPVAGVQITARGLAVGVTNPAGELQVALDGVEGEPLPISVRCPAGYAGAPEKSIVILRSSQGPNGQTLRPISHGLGCQPVQRDAVVLVHAGGDAAELPVTIDGAVVGTTDSLGYALFHLRTDPKSRFEVALDTSAHDKLTPRNPKQAFVVEDQDEIFLFDKSFTLPSKSKGKKRRRR